MSSTDFLPCRIAPEDVPRPITRTQIHEAVKRAAQAWVDEYGGQSAGERAASERGTPITQQNLSWASRGEKIGEKMAHAVAELYDTTPEGVVVLFLGGVDFTELRNVPGWAKAKAEAMSERGNKVDAWVWALIDEVRVPARLKLASARMVLDIAQFLDNYGQSSGVRARVTLEQ